MRHDAPPRRLGLDAMVEALPGLADVIAAIDRPVGAARRRAQRRVHDLRVERRSADVAAIGQGREAADLHVFPMLALVAAAEEAHAVGEKYGARRRRAAGERVTVEHAL